MKNMRIVHFLYTDFLAAAVVVVIQYIFGFSVIAYGYNHVNPVTTTLAVCKIYNYADQSTAMMQRWFMTAISFDRYACTSSRADLRRFATVRVARRVVLVIVAIWLVIPVYRLVFYDLRPNECGIFSSSLVALINGIYTAVAGAILPLSIMVSSLLLNQHNLALKRQRRHQMVVQHNERRHAAQEVDRKRDQQILAIMTIQVIAYIITIIPLTTFQIYSAATVSILNKSTDRVIIEQFFNLIATTLVKIYSSLSFYLNTITSRMFREELLIAVRNVLRCTWLTNTTRVEPIASNTATERAIAGHQSIQISASKTFVPSGKMLGCAIKADPQQADMDPNIAQ